VDDASLQETSKIYFNISMVVQGEIPNLIARDGSEGGRRNFYRHWESTIRGITIS